MGLLVLMALYTMDRCGLLVLSEFQLALGELQSLDSSNLCQIKQISTQSPEVSCRADHMGLCVQPNKVDHHSDVALYFS